MKLGCSSCKSFHKVLVPFFIIMEVIHVHYRMDVRSSLEQRLRYSWDTGDSCLAVWSWAEIRVGLVQRGPGRGWEEPARPQRRGTAGSSPWGAPLCPTHSQHGHVGTLSSPEDVRHADVEVIDSSLEIQKPRFKEVTSPGTVHHGLCAALSSCVPSTSLHHADRGAHDPLPFCPAPGSPKVTVRSLKKSSYPPTTQRAPGVHSALLCQPHSASQQRLMTCPQRHQG